MKILVDDTPVVILKNGSVYKHKIEPGEYTISCKMAYLSGIKLNVEQGKDYYIRCYINPGFWSGIPILELIDSASGRSAIEGPALKNQIYKYVPSERPRSRVGIFFGGGIGFEEIEMGHTDQNDMVTLSTGGGFMIGAGYGREITRYFDLSVDFYYQSGSNIPPVNNFNASFSRIAIAATPALIIPIKGGDYVRLRLGAGPDLHLNNMMKISGSEAGGDDFVLKYESAVGIHGSVVLENNISEKASVMMGVKFNSVNYDYTIDGSTGSSTDPLANHPDGKGISFFIGYSYHFF